MGILFGDTVLKLIGSPNLEYTQLAANIEELA